MVMGKGISGLVSTMSMLWRSTVMLPASQTKVLPYGSPSLRVLLNSPGPA